MKVNLNCVSRGISRAGLALKKHSPEILMVAGTAGVVVSAVMACKATLKVNDILEETKETVDVIHEATEKGKTNDGREYSEDDSKKDLVITYAQTGVKFVKLYGPSVVLGALSLGAMITSNNILRKRNVALAAAYAVVDKSFKDYRSNVIERFGEKVDQELKNNIKAKVIEVVETDEDGKERVITEDADICEKTSGFSRFFSDSSAWVEGDMDHNRAYVNALQNVYNSDLDRKNHVYLGNVLHDLGYDVERELEEAYKKGDQDRIDLLLAGQYMGWVYDKNDPHSDNYIDFGAEVVTRLVDGKYKKDILLTFNVQNVFDYYQNNGKSLSQTGSGNPYQDALDGTL